MIYSVEEKAGEESIHELTRKNTKLALIREVSWDFVDRFVPAKKPAKPK